MVRDYLAEVTDVDPATVAYNVRYDLPPGVTGHLSAVQAFRDEAAHAQSRAAEESRAAAIELCDQGMTLREVGTLLGISHQRAQQLT